MLRKICHWIKAQQLCQKLVLSLFLSYLFLLPPPTSVPFSLSDNKPLLLLSDEPSLSFLSHAEEPLRCGHLLPEGVSKPPAGTLQPNPGKPWKLFAFSAWSPCISFCGEGRMKNSKIWFFGDLKLPCTAWHFTFSGCFLGHPFSV